MKLLPLFSRLLILPVLSLALPAQTNWEVRNPTPTDSLMNQLAFGAGTFVAVGTAGTVLTSTDGATWTEQARLPGRPNLAKVIFGGTQFVALDTNGVSYTSSDGTAWTKRTSTGGLGPIAYGGGTFLTMSTGNLFATSTDGATWTQRTTGTTLTGTSVDFGGGLFVVATQSRVYLTTPDGITWTARSFPTGATVNKIVFGNGFFVALLADGSTAQSTDAIDWKTPATPTFLGLDLASANGTFFATRSGAGTFSSSTDGLTWTDSTATFPISPSPSIAYGNGTYVTTHQGTTYSYWGPYGNYNTYQYTLFDTSSDGHTWTHESTFFTPDRGLAYGLGTFIAGNYVSSDGIYWSRGGFVSTLPKQPTSNENDYWNSYYIGFSYRLSFAHDRFFAFQQGYPYSVYTSTDGATSQLALSTTNLASSVAYGAGRYIIVCSSAQLMVSSDGSSWTTQNTGASATLSDITFAQGTFVVGTSSASVLTSPDGQTWTTQALPAQGGYATACVAYGSGQFLLMRTNGESFTSTDGITWVSRPTVSFVPNRLAFANGTFVALTSDAANPLYTSSDGITWTARDTHSSSPLDSLAFGNGQWVACSSTGGVVIQSDTTSGAAVAPSVVLSPTNRSIVGDGTTTTTLLVATTGTGPFGYQWYKDGVAIPGATSQTYSFVLPAVTGTEAHNYTVTVTGAGGSVSSTAATISDIPPQPPVITVQPGDTSIIFHGYVTLYVTAGGTGPFTYQWRKNGQPLVASASHLWLNATSSSLSLDNVSPSDAGLYDVVVTGRAGSTTSRAAQLTINHSRLVNLSARANVASGDDVLIAGFVLANDNAAASAANWTLLVRGAGPALKDLGVANALGNPSVDLYQSLGGQQLLQANNDNWDTYTEPLKSVYAQASAAVGAFAFAPNSLDAGLIRQGYQLSYNTTPQIYSAKVYGLPGQTGVALVEVYDASLVHARLMNLSARARVGTGENVLIAGFVISGNQPLKVLLRGVGPSLVKQGVTAALADPKLTLFDHTGTAIQSNDTWSQAANVADLRSATGTVGAFALNESSKDAAMLTTLDPGIYTLQVSSVDGTSGIALVEIYEVP